MDMWTSRRSTSARIGQASTMGPRRFRAVAVAVVAVVAVSACGLGPEPEGTASPEPTATASPHPSPTTPAPTPSRESGASLIVPTATPREVIPVSQAGATRIASPVPTVRPERIGAQIVSVSPSAPAVLHFGEPISLIAAVTNTGDSARSFHVGIVLMDGNGFRPIGARQAVFVSPRETETVGWRQDLGPAGNARIAFAVWPDGAAAAPLDVQPPVVVVITIEAPSATPTPSPTPTPTGVPTAVPTSTQSPPSQVVSSPTSTPAATLTTTMIAALQPTGPTPAATPASGGTLTPTPTPNPTATPASAAVVPVPVPVPTPSATPTPTTMPQGSAQTVAFDPQTPTQVTVGQSISLSLTFTNTGETARRFVAKADVTDAALTVHGAYSTVLTTPLAAGGETTVNWDHDVDGPGDFWVDFSVWAQDQGVASIKLAETGRTRLVVGVSAPTTTPIPSPTPVIILTPAATPTATPQAADPSAEIVEHSPNVVVQVTIGQGTLLSATIANTRNIPWSFVVRARVEDGSGTLVADYVATVSPALPSGQQTTVSWEHVPAEPGDYYIQFSVWRGFAQTASNLLDLAPDTIGMLLEAVRFQAGQSVRTVVALDVRSGPSTVFPEITHTNYAGVAPSGTTGTVVGGPFSSGGLTWWDVQYGPGYRGWAAEFGLTAE